MNVRFFMRKSNILVILHLIVEQQHMEKKLRNDPNMMKFQNRRGHMSYTMSGHQK